MNPIINTAISQTTDIVANQVINTAISQSAEKTIEGLIQLSISLANTNLISQEAAKNFLTYATNEFGKDFVANSIKTMAAEGATGLATKAATVGVATKGLSIGVSKNAVNKGIQMAFENGSFWNKSLQTFAQNSGKTTLLSFASIPAELGVAYISKSLGADQNTSDGLGFAAGLSTSVGVGCIAGPVGALVGGGSYLLGKGVGSLINFLFFRKPKLVSPNNDVINQINTLDENHLREIYKLISEKYKRYPETFREKYLTIYADEIFKIIQIKYLDGPFDSEILIKFTLDAINKIIDKNIVNIIETLGKYYPNSEYVKVLISLKNQLDKLNEFLKFSKIPVMISKLLASVIITVMNGGSLRDVDLTRLKKYLLDEMMKFIINVLKSLKNNMVNFIEKFIDDLLKDLLEYKLGWEFEKLIIMLNLIIAYRFYVTYEQIINCFK